MDGEEKTFNYIKDQGLLTEDVQLTYPAEIQVGSAITVTYAGEVDPENMLYSLTLGVNEEVAEGKTITYTVKAKDFKEGELNVYVKLNKLPTDSIEVVFNISEDVGKIYVNGEEVNVGENVSIVETHRVDIEVTLNEGYAYTGYKHNTDLEQNPKNDTDEYNKVLIPVCTSFSTSEHSGIYTIYVVKKEVEVKLTLTEEQKGNYSITSLTADASSTSEHLTGMAVLGEITLHEKETDGMRFNKLMYRTKAGKVSLAEGEKELELTSAMLSELPQSEGKYTLELEVESINRYKLEVKYSASSESKRDVVRLSTSKELTSGGKAKYYDAGTTIDLKVEVKAAEDVGKYTLTLKEGETLLQSGTVLDLNEASGNGITLTSNRVVTVYIEENAYMVKVDKESVYQTLNQLNNLTPTELENTSWINNLNVVGNKYKETATLSIKYKHSEANELDRVLYRIILKGNNTEDTIFEIENGKVVESVQNGYAAVIVGDRIQISYTTLSELNIELEYLEVKNIFA